MTVGADMTRDIVELLRTSDGPLTAKQVAGKLCDSLSSKNVEKIEAALHELIAKGTAFEYPPERKGSGGRFGHLSPEHWVGGRIVANLKEAGGRLTIGQTRNSLRKWEIRYFDEVLGKLVSEKKLFYLTVRLKYVLSSPPDPYDHLLPRQITALREIVERINRHRKNNLSMEDLREFLNGAGPAAIPASKTSGIPTEDLIREWYNKDLPAQGGLPSIPIPSTWSHYDAWCLLNSLTPNLDEFKNLLWRLYRAGKVEFVPHSFTQRLQERELEVSLRGPHGEVWYYWKWR